MCLGTRRTPALLFDLYKEVTKIGGLEVRAYLYLYPSTSLSVYLSVCLSLSFSVTHALRYYIYTILYYTITIYFTIIYYTILYYTIYFTYNIYIIYTYI